MREQDGKPHGEHRARGGGAGHAGQAEGRLLAPPSPTKGSTIKALASHTATA